MSAGFMFRTNEPVFPRVTSPVLWTVITAAAGSGPPSGYGASLAGGWVGPPSGRGPAWMIGASAKATTNSMAVNWVFRFFMLLNFLSLLGLPGTLVIENSFLAF